MQGQWRPPCRIKQRGDFLAVERYMWFLGNHRIRADERRGLLVGGDGQGWAKTLVVGRDLGGGL